MVRSVAAQLTAWDTDPVTQGLSVAINISGRLVVEPGVGAAMAREIHHAGIDPRRIILEITESLLMEDMRDAVPAAGAGQAAVRRRLRHRIFVAEPPEHAADRRGKDRPFVC